MSFALSNVRFASSNQDQHVFQGPNIKYTSSMKDVLETAGILGDKEIVQHFENVAIGQNVLYDKLLQVERKLDAMA